MRKITFKLSGDGDDQVGYLYLPSHPINIERGVSKSQIDLSSLIKYKGPTIIMDFDANDVLIGIEVIG
jgi:hypothetical protein